MKNCKRLSCLIAVVLLCLLLVCPAYAVDSSAPELTDEILTDEDLFELEYERLLIEGFDDEGAISVLSLDDNNLDRTWSYTGTIKWYDGPVGNPLDSPDVAWFIPNSPVNFDWQGSGSYLLATATRSYTERYWGAVTGVTAGTYIDWFVPSVYVFQEGATLRFSGTVLTNFTASWLNSLSFVSYDMVDTVGEEWVIYPDRMAILVNGDIVTSVTSDANGSFTFDYEFPMIETVNSVGYRFYFDTTQKKVAVDDSTSGSIKTYGLWFFIDDNAFTSYVVPDASTVINKQILEQVKQIPATIYNFFFGDSGDDAAGGFKSDVDSAVSSVDQVQQEIVEGLDKPEPDAIVPDLEEVVPQEDYTVYTDIFAPVMQSSLFTSMMLIVVSMAFVSYVLFGKKG